MKQQPENTLKNPMARRAWHVAELVAELRKVLKNGYRDLLTASGRQARVRKCATEIYVEVGPVLDYLERRFDQSKALLMAQRLDRLLVGYQECALLAVPAFEKQIPVDATHPGNAVIALTLSTESLLCAQYIQGWAMEIEQDALKRSPPATEQADAGCEGFDSADTLWLDHGISRSQLSRAATAGTVSTRKAPKGYKNTEGRTIRKLYNEKQAIKHCSVKKKKRPLRRR